MKRFRGHAITLALTSAVAIGFFVGLLTWSGNAPWIGGYNVNVLVPTAGSLGSGANVRIGGLQVGKVTSVDRMGAAAVLELTLWDEVKTPIPADSRVQVRLRTVVGENYVELLPGRSSEQLEDGGTLPMSAANQYVEADEILSVLRGKTRERARQLLQDVGAGMRGQGARLNGLLEHTGGALLAADDVVAVLGERHAQVARLIEDTNAITRAIGERTEVLKDLASASTTTFKSLAASGDALEATFDELPPTLRQLQGTSELLREVSGSSATVVANLSRALDDVLPAIRSLRPAAEEGQALLQQLSTAAPELRTTLGRARVAAGPLAETMWPLHETLCELNPLVRHLSPYHREFSALLTNMGSSTNFYDATGHAARLYIVGGAGSLGIATDEMRDAYKVLRRFGFADFVLPEGYNPYPKPGGAGHPSGGEGELGPDDSTLPYTRVEADC